jgi:hypothetical protein
MFGSLALFHRIVFGFLRVFVRLGPVICASMLRCAAAYTVPREWGEHSNPGGLGGFLDRLFFGSSPEAWIPAPKDLVWSKYSCDAAVVPK